MSTPERRIRLSYKNRVYVDRCGQLRNRGHASRTSANSSRHRSKDGALADGAADGALPEALDCQVLGRGLVPTGGQVDFYGSHSS